MKKSWHKSAKKLHKEYVLKTLWKIMLMINYYFWRWTFWRILGNNCQQSIINNIFTKNSSQQSLKEPFKTTLLKEPSKTFILRTISNIDFQKMIFEWLLSETSQTIIINNSLPTSVRNIFTRNFQTTTVSNNCQASLSENLQKHSFQALFLAMILKRWFLNDCCQVCF